MQSRVQIANAIAIIMCDKLNYITSSSDQFVDEIRDRDENKSPATVSLYHLKFGYYSSNFYRIIMIIK